MRRVELTASTAIVVLFLASGSMSSAQQNSNPVQEIDALTQQWTSLEQQKDRLRAEWRAQKPVLEQQLALLEREIMELSTLLEETSAQQDDVEQRRLELLGEQTELEEEAAAVEATLGQASRELRALHRSLPPPLASAWTEELARLDDPAGTASERFRMLIELLRELDDFDAKVTLNESVMPLEDGRDHVVKQVYLGLSHGWYVTADQRFGGAGTAGRDGWVWTPVADTAPIAKIVDVLEQRFSPALVSIPLELTEQQQSGGGN